MACQLSGTLLLFEDDARVVLFEGCMLKATQVLFGAVMPPASFVTSNWIVFPLALAVIEAVTVPEPGGIGMTRQTFVVAQLAAAALSVAFT